MQVSQRHLEITHISWGLPQLSLQLITRGADLLRNTLLHSKQFIERLTEEYIQLHSCAITDTMTFRLSTLWGAHT